MKRLIVKDRVFHDFDRWLKRYYPNEHEKRRIEKMTPSELGEHLAKKALKGVDK